MTEVVNREYVDRCESIDTAFRRESSAESALAKLDWWDIVGGGEERVGDPASFGAIFEMQGRHLISSNAMGAVSAAPIVAAAGRSPVPTDTMALAGRQVGDSIQVSVLRASHGQVVAMGPSGNPVRLTRDQLDPGHGTAIDADLATVFALRRDASVDELDGDLDLGLARGRVAAAFELLGVSTKVLEDAVLHAKERRQFGKPIGEFQAVRHMLAESYVLSSAIRDCCMCVIEDQSPRWPDPRLAMQVKAVAGRNARGVLQRTGQVLGAMSFTWEHPHHRYRRRALALDSAFGSSRELGREIAETLLPDGESIWAVGLHS